MASSERHKEQSRINANIYSQALRELRDKHPDEFDEIWRRLGGGSGKGNRVQSSPLKNPSGTRYCPECKQRRSSIAFAKIQSGRTARTCFWCSYPDQDIDHLLEDFHKWLQNC